MSYQQTLYFLYRQLPMFQRIGAAAFKKDLTNTRALLAALDHPEDKFRSIHIAGTNGEGSVTHLLSGMLQAAGRRTGLYVSPHYKDFRERIRINGEYVSEAEVVDFVERIRPEIEKIEPSFFELTVAMAFDHFARHAVDIAVVEVGMGGRLDSTNVLRPELSVITNISYDHQQFLGDTLPLIAAEKAGIIKPGVPVVIGETQEETMPVFQAKAVEHYAPIYFADQHYRATPLHADLNHTYYRIEKDGELRYDELPVNLHGPYQALNLQTALAAIDFWQQSTAQALPEQAICEALYNLRELTRFMGRWQILQENPTVLVDSAHNEGGLRPVLEALRALPHHRLHIVLGVVNDKDLSKALPLFPTQARYYFAKADIPRGLPADELRQAAALYGLQGASYSSVPEAYTAALGAAEAADVVFVGGSIFTVAEVL